MSNQLVYISRVIIAAYIGLILIFNTVELVSASGIDANSVNAASASGATVSAPEVFGGEDVDLANAPAAVAIVDVNIPNAYYGLICGGTLIEKNLVLTAAHCVNTREPGDIDVVADTLELSSNDRERIGVIDIIIHPEYDRNTAYADIAIVKLAGDSRAGTADIISSDLFSRWSSLLDADSTATVFGWGATAERTRSNHLQSVALPLVDAETCQSAYSDEGYVVAQGTICAGFASGGKDACRGDSGGPLMMPNPENGSWLQIGIVSWGEGCAEADSYGVYTSILPYLSWISETVVNEVTVVDASGALDGTIFNPMVSGSGVEEVIFLPLIQ